MEDSKKAKATLVTGVIGEDVHIVGIRILEHALQNEVYNIVALGAQTTQQEFIDVARETNARAILVSSLSGHANVLVAGLREKCDEAGLKNILLYLGGAFTVVAGGFLVWQLALFTFGFVCSLGLRLRTSLWVVVKLGLIGFDWVCF